MRCFYTEEGCADGLGKIYDIDFARTADQGCDTAEHPDAIAGRPFCGNRQAYRQSGVEA